jgi:2-polyprenyl-6-hydroxyphenyl methylase/3-demethylubiquinone-9 3-methyltransferase
MTTEPYDFSRCKLCGEAAAVPRYRLKETSILVCAACDFHFISQLDTLPKDLPADVERSLDVSAWNFIEGKLKRNRRQLGERLALVSRSLALDGAKALDIGAGVGLFSQLLKEAGALPYGIEPQLVFRQFAQEKFGVTLHAETVDIPFWQEGFPCSFDLVTLWDTLEHLNFPVETLQDAVRLLKPGGFLALDTPSRDSLYYKISEWSYRLSNGANSRSLNSLYSPKPFRHKQLFTVRQLTGLIERLGLQIVSMNRSRLLDPSNKIVLVAQKPPE